jgi:hypothetical protein
LVCFYGEVKKKKLTIHDFAFHDPLVDLLHVLKIRRLPLRIKRISSKINDQKKTLKGSRGVK